MRSLSAHLFSQFLSQFSRSHFSHFSQLRELEDIYYLRDMMSLELDTKEAAEKMETLIGECLHSKATKFNNFVHILAH